MRVIRNIVEMILLVILYDFLIFNNSVDQTKEETLKIYDNLSDGIISLESDVYTLVFDYDYINNLISNKFNDYEYEIIKISEGSFVFKVNIKSMFFNKEIQEKFYIKRGEMYEKFN